MILNKYPEISEMAPIIILKKVTMVLSGIFIGEILSLDFPEHIYCCKVVKGLYIEQWKMSIEEMVIAIYNRKKVNTIIFKKCLIVSNSLELNENVVNYKLTFALKMCKKDTN